MKSSINTSLTWKTTFSFVTLATLLILLIGWLIKNHVLPVKTVIDYGAWATNFIRLWIWVAIVVGLLFPGIAFFVWLRHPEPRKILGFYLLVLLVQIITEQVLSSTLFPSLVVIIGTIYTVYRLWQLWQGQQVVNTNTQFNTFSQRVLKSLLQILLFFWSINLAVLLILCFPAIL
ncbi:hypothetical protein [Mastigocladopsis repens]|uniref:hypothetical protein n=1 Tax=Mastigocladopsis repens TaxID=221287 RepID=UPI0003829A27|nr:hypothetical protein [Mastigocladopsis repens]